MNERLHEMVLEFAEIAEEYSYVEYAKKQTGYCRQYFYNQKFAELIVRECLGICKEKERANLYGVREVEAAIKSHFGVEE